MKRIFVTTTLGVLLTTAPAATVFYGPTDYQKRADSPFYAGIQSGDTYLEDFEDARFNTPYATPSFGQATTRQGVDEDDGRLDSRNTGWVYFSSRYISGYDGIYFNEITFVPNESGQYPSYVGFALLGFTPESLIETGFHDWLFFDSEGVPFTDGPQSYEIPRYSDNLPQSFTGGTRFVGIASDRGISRVLISAPTYDHLQYGWTIPEPGSAGLAVAGLLAAGCRRRRAAT
jgi:hypothetical protein